MIIQYDKEIYKKILFSAVFTFLFIGLIAFFIFRDSDWTTLVIFLPFIIVGIMGVCKVFYGWYRLSKVSMPLILLEEDQITLYKEHGKDRTILQSNVKYVSFDTEGDDMVILIIYLYENKILTCGECIMSTVLRVFFPMDNIQRFVLTCVDEDVQLLKTYFRQNNIKEINEDNIQQDFYVIGRSFYIFIASIITFLLGIAVLPKILIAPVFGIVFCIWILDTIKNKSTFYQSELTVQCIIKVNLWAAIIGLYWSLMVYIPGSFAEVGICLSIQSVFVMCIVLFIAFIILVPKNNLYVSFWSKRTTK